MAGGFVLVVGPSGAGKDTLIAVAREELAGDARFVFPKRIVTRPASAHEDHETLDEASFRAARDAGGFALWWEAHGLFYALPASAREAACNGCIVVCNVSRAVIAMARTALPGVAVVEVSASRDTLSRRLKARARADDGDLGARLSRTDAVAPVAADLVIRNEGPVREAADMLVRFLRARADEVAREATVEPAP